MAVTQKFIRLASLLYWLTVALIGALAICYVGLLIVRPPSAETADIYFENRSIAQAATGGHFWAAAIFDALVVVAILWTLNVLRNLFDQYRHGVALTQTCAVLIGRIGRGVVAIAVLRLLSYPVQTVILTMAAPVGGRQLAIGINSSDVALLLAGGLLTVIGWAMHDAVIAADENKAFI